VALHEKKKEQSNAGLILENKQIGVLEQIQASISEQFKKFFI